MKLAVAYTGTSGPRSGRRLLRRHLFAEGFVAGLG